MDIVYLVKESKTNPELIYSLRSLVNLPHDKVFIVGGLPDGVDRNKVIHISVLQGNNKYQNTINNLQLICKNESLSDDFILMNDDFFIIKPIQSTEELNLCRGTVDSVLKIYIQRYKDDSAPYLVGMNQTKIFLQDMGISNPLCYELHTPMVFNKEKVLKMYSLPYIKSIPVLHQRTVYGNLYYKNSKTIQDVKVFRDFFYPLGSDKFLSSEDNSFPRVKTYLDSIFSEKSQYES